jgi:Carbohydrate binding module (family 6)
MFPQSIESSRLPVSTRISAQCLRAAIRTACACSLLGTMILLGAPRSAHAVGATTPFTSYEAETGTLGGGATTVALTAAPNTQFSSPALEASGHAYVQLTGTGQAVQWTNNTGQPVAFINIRESIPDAPGGGGITATLNLYVNGVFRQSINLNSKQTWIYEGNNNYQGNDQNPADGDPHVFFDEAHTFITGAPIAPGSTFALQKDASNTASFYYIDVVDVENPPPPLTQPANSISIASCGAVADPNPTNGAANSGAVDSTAAIQNCINQAQAQGKILWIPQGTFYLLGTNGLQAQGITIQGAGMWYSTIYRNVPLPNNVGLAAAFSVTSCTVRNFHIDSNALSRGTNDGDGGAMDTTGTNWLADGMWHQHVESGFWASGTGGTIQNSRITQEWADGININNVSLTGTVGNNITVNNNFIRGTGDDALAINSVNYNTTSSGNVFYTPMANATVTNNTSVAPWQGKGLGIYGGSGHYVANNYIVDTGRYLGLGIGKFGVNGSDLLSATVTGNVIVRSGGNGFNQGQPSLQIGNGGDGQGVGTVTAVTVSGNTIIDSLYDSIGFSTATDITLEDNTIIQPGRNGIGVSPPFYPAPSGSASLTANSVSGVQSANAAFLNDSSGFSATLTGNSWQLTASEGPYNGAVASIPGTVQAANYDVGGPALGYNILSINGTANNYRPDGVDLEVTSDTGGGDDLGWTSSGQWFRYTVNVASPGLYTVSFRVAAPSAVTDAFHLSNSSGVNLSGPVNIPTTGGWQMWTTVTATVTLAAGQQVLTLSEDDGGWNITHASFAAAPETPFGSTPASIPGTIQAENYDVGAVGVAYVVNSTNGTANGYRSDGVDLETTADAGGGYDLGWTSGGQWFRYTVNVAAAGEYTVSFRVAAPGAVEDAFHVSSSSGADLSGPINIPATGDWQNWATVTATVTLSAGQEVLTFDQDNGGWNLNYASFASASGSSSATAAPGPARTRVPTVRPRIGVN